MDPSPIMLKSKKDSNKLLSDAGDWLSNDPWTFLIVIGIFLDIIIIFV